VRLVTGLSDDKVGGLHRHVAREHNIPVIVGDPLPVQGWQTAGCPVVITNSIIRMPLPNPERIINLGPNFYGIWYYAYELYDTSLTRSFNCLINRTDPIRQSWLYQLIRHGLFDHGYISFNIDLKRAGEFQNLDYQEAFDQQYEKYLRNFETEHAMIRDRVPFKNFSDQGDITSVIYDSKFSIVIETYFTDNGCGVFTEKTFRALQIPRPWILFSYQHAVQDLRDMGFDVMDDVIDHDSYDSLESPIDRQAQLISLASDMIDRGFDHDRSRQAALHNQTLLAHCWHTWKDHYQTCVQQAIVVKQKLST